MFFALSKVLDLALAPLTWAVGLWLAALLLRRRRAGPVLGLLGVTVLLVFSLEPVARGLYGCAERGAPSTYRAQAHYDAVIILGGLVDLPATRASGEVELIDTAERLLRGFELLRAGAVDHVLISGGPPGPGPGQGSEAALLAGKLRAWGVPAGQIVLEEQSLNTRENAAETARVVAGRGWSRLLLVTSAAHMERALGCFRKVGLRPDALPVDFRGGESETWRPRAEWLRDSTAALRELAGRVVYRWLGYSTP